MASNNGFPVEARLRQGYPAAHTPTVEKTFVSDYSDEGNVFDSPYGGNRGKFVEEPTLSKFLANVFVSAKKGLARPAPTFLTPSSSDLSLPYLSSLIPKENQPSQPTSTSRIRLPTSATIKFILLCALWYLSSAMSSNTGKSILTRFQYPVTLTFVQFAFVAAYSVLCLGIRERFSSHPHSHGSILDKWGIKIPSRTIFQGTFIMSLFQIAGHVFSSMAIARVPVSTVHTIKALSPLFTVISYVVLFRVRYSPATYLALIPLTLGVMLACSFDMRANAIGFLCALGSTLIFVSQNIFSKKLLPKESSTHTPLATNSSGKLDKLNLLLYSSGMAFLLMVPIWLWSDGAALFNVWYYNEEALHSLKADMTTSTASLVFWFFANGTVHFAQNLIAFSILARTSPVTYSIASLVKRIAVICIAIVWANQQVSLIQGIGMTMTFGGLWMYNKAKSDVDKGERKRDSVERDAFLPTSLEDSRYHDNSLLKAPVSGVTRSVQPHYIPSSPLAHTSIVPPRARTPPPHASAGGDFIGTDAETVANAPIAGVSYGHTAHGSESFSLMTSRKMSSTPIPYGNTGGPSATVTVVR